MKKLKKNLQTVNKDLKALAKKVDKIKTAVDQLEKSKASKKPQPKAVQTKTAKKAPAKKASVKKAGPLTAVDTVFGIINRSKKGVNTEILIKKTGYNQKKIFNLIYKLKKQGKIKSAEKGVYVKA